MYFRAFRFRDVLFSFHASLINDCPEDLQQRQKEMESGTQDDPNPSDLATAERSFVDAARASHGSRKMNRGRGPLRPVTRVKKKTISQSFGVVDEGGLRCLAVNWVGGGGEPRVFVATSCSSMRSVTTPLPHCCSASFRADSAPAPTRGSAVSLVPRHTCSLGASFSSTA